MKSWPASIFRSAARPLLACAIWYVALMGLHFIPGMERHDTIFMMVGVISAVLAMLVMIALGSNVDGRVELHPDRIAVGKRSIERHGLRGEVVQWTQANLWTTLGSAIHLQNARASLFIGGRDCLLATRGRPSTQKVAASLTASDFLEFVRSLGLIPDPLAGTARDDTLVIDLQTSTATVGGIWRTMGPWFLTMALAAAVGLLSAFTPALRTGAGLVVIQAATVIIVVGGLAYTIMKSLRPPRPRYQLVVGPTRVALRDLAAGSIDTSTPRPKAVPRIYRMSTRGGTFEFPAMRLDWPSKSIVVGVWDAALVWPAGTERTRKLQYLMGPEEWRQLVRALDLG
jgi:hypothetical protein